ncbi:SRPBCC family protein [Rufibacter immobilis]|uniref:SRPBCC family protein n=1 Tax=Rufibacter immobilis TaxID=1348778 RepID=A0A3M9MQP2_9BACT|nr:SRPBCC family protein [Rufibacter immobilis]RNI27525.1 SRPBCC family protein [Rufibacter immobilis]
MPTLEGVLEVHAPQEALFDLSQDYDQRLLWDKYLRVARLEHGAEQAQKGVEAYCESRKGIGMTVRYLTYHPPTQVAMEMTKGPWVFQKFSGSWRFKPVGNSSTHVYFRYHYKPKFGWMGKLLLQPFISSLLRTDIKNRLRFFKEAVESGILDTKK